MIFRNDTTGKIEAIISHPFTLEASEHGIVFRTVYDLYFIPFDAVYGLIRSAILIYNQENPGGLLTLSRGGIDDSSEED